MEGSAALIFIPEAGCIAVKLIIQWWLHKVSAEHDWHSLEFLSFRLAQHSMELCSDFIF
jgi:hypothetical protein